MISGQTELGSNTYVVETRQTDTGVWQFRVVDENGTAMNIRNQSAANNTLTTTGSQFRPVVVHMIPAEV